MSLILRRGPLCGFVSAIALLSALAPAGRSFAEPAPAFAELLRQSQASAPQLAEAVAGVRQAEGVSRQSAARPNPTATVGVENFNGSGPYRGNDLAETTVSIGQPLELGGKRSARIAAGRAGLDAARARLTQSRADFAFTLAATYAQAEAAERQVALAQESLTLAQDVLRVARALVEAGKEAELRSLQAQAAVTAARADLDAARAEQVGAFARLTALVGSPTPLTSLGESLLTRPGGATRRPVDLSTTPAVLAAEAEREAAARRVRVERTRAVPDLTVSAGMRRFSGDGSTAVVAGFSLPIPVFDQNRGNITAVQGELQAAEARLNAARLDAQAELSTALFQVDAAQTRVAAAMDGEGTAAEAFRLTRIAYEAGKAPLVELIAARRSLADARAQTLEAQLTRLRAEAGLARLEGRPIGDR